MQLAAVQAKSFQRWRTTIFFASGFAGLIYESIWTHYLKLFLGHAAYAQTLVLAIFMGGMAIGAALVARNTIRIASPLHVYALVEAAIGLLALVFHPIFTGATGGFFDFAFTRHIDGATFTTLKWSLATLLILPQSILLGATFPLFASAATRGTPDAQGRSIAMLYFSNSIGGALGVLASGFLLIPEFGLFGTIAIAGAMNFAIAGLVVFMARAPRADAVAPDAVQEPAASVAAPASEPVAGNRARKRRERRERAAAAASPAVAASPAAAASGPPRAVAVRMLLAISFLTGASSFIYEIGWIRMLSLVLGSATHSFELMLSSFVMGLAFGGLWISRRIDKSSNPGVLLGRIQIAMGCVALATVPLHSLTFDMVAWALQQLPRSDGGYALFNLLRYGVSSLIMFPAAFFAGMTLPLATRLLYSVAGQGERAIGLIYSANTLGAIAGIAFAVHVGLPLIGIEYLIGVGAVIDVVLGAVLLAAYGPRTGRQFAVASVVVSVGLTVLFAQTFDPQKLGSGVFRSGRASSPATVLQIAHGKTATITVETADGILAIRTNGKADASANPSLAAPGTSDELTMTLAGAIPLLIHDAPRQVANIGFGSGLTTATLLADPRLEHLDTVEIEPKVVELARHFDPLIHAVYTDPRSAIRIEDGKSFFAANGKTYDMIVSEPSNPWVSGVAGLFSVEFYRHVSRYLKPDGLFVQWLQTYETDRDRLVSVLKAIDQSFDDYMVVAISTQDILLIGRPRGKIAMPPNAYARAATTLKERMRRVSVVNQSDVTTRIVGNKALLRPWLIRQPVAANSDFVPYLDSHADRDRFFDREWPELVNVALSAVPVAEMLGSRPPLPTPSALTITSEFGLNPRWLGARMLWEQFHGPAQGPDAFPVPMVLPADISASAKEIFELCMQPPAGDPTLGAARIAVRALPHLSPTEGGELLKRMAGAPCLQGLQGADVMWRLLLQHMAARDAQAFGGVADDMLQAGQGTNAVKTRYLLAMAMLGRIRAGQPDRALALWRQFAPRALEGEPPGLVLELLFAHAAMGARAR